MVRRWLSLTSGAIALTLSRLVYPLRLALYYVAGNAIAFVLLGVVAPNAGSDGVGLVVAFGLLCVFGLPYAVSWFLSALFYRGLMVSKPREIVIVGTFLIGVIRFAAVMLAPDELARGMAINLRVASAAAIVGFVVLSLSCGAEWLMTRQG